MLGSLGDKPLAQFVVGEHPLDHHAQVLGVAAVEAQPDLLAGRHHLAQATGVGDDALRLAAELVRGLPGGSLIGVHISRQDITPSRGGKSPADELLEKAVQRARGFGVELQPVHATGDIGRGVCAAAAEYKADLVVIASQDRRPLVARALVDLDRLLGSSVSDYIRVHAPAPVLLVREPEGRR